MAADPLEAAELRVREVAAAYDRGWAFTPLAGKKPTRKGWTTEPRASLESTLEWARQGNVGLRTGAASGVVVVDDDTVDGSGTAALELPATPTVITGSGKKHYYFRALASGLRNSASKIADHVDIRADGGQVVFVGSVHPDTGAPYCWAPGLSPDEVPLADLPQSLLLRLARPRARSSASRDPGDGLRGTWKGSTLLAREVAAVASAPEGQRNDSLNRAAFTLGGAVGAGLLERDQVEVALFVAAANAGLDTDEIATTIRSGLDAGLNVPLTRVNSESRANAKPTQTSRSRPSERSDGRPTVRLGGASHLALDQIEVILGAGDQPAIFNRGGVLARVIRIPIENADDGIKRPAGLAMVVPIDAPGLCDLINRNIRLLRTRKNEKGWQDYEVPVPANLARELIARREWKSIPVLHGVVAGPVVLPDGSLLAREGYHRSRGLYVDLDGLEVPAVPDRPTFEQARAALDEIHAFYSSLPFVTAEDASVALAATLTPIARPSFTSSPLFAASAPTLGTGKSLLCDAVSVVATGRTAPAMTQATDDEENRKLIFSLLMESGQVLLIDNCTRPLSGASLCSALTQEFIRGRILGSSATAVLPARHATWFASGNNLVVEGDMRRRTLVCLLDAKTERPWERRFERDLTELAKEARARLLAAVLTVLRWRLTTAAKLCPSGIKPFGGFRGWSRVVREAIVLLGYPDPLAVLARNDVRDPETLDISTLHDAWAEALGTGRATSAEVAHAATSDAALMQALSAVGCVDRGPAVNTRRLGRYLGKLENRRLNGRFFERVGEQSNATVWRLATDAASGATEFRESRELVSSPACEEGETASTSSGERTNDPHETNGSSMAADATAPCEACGATAWWVEHAPGVWVCRACRAPAGAGYAAAAAEGDV